MSDYKVGQSKKVREIKELIEREGITQDILKYLFSYDPDTGIVTRRVFVNSRAKVGDVVGYLDSSGYLRVRIGSKNYMLHRIIWMILYGYFPEHQVDHENKNKLDNSKNNLREVSPQCNMRNCPVYKRNKSGVTGVCWIRGGKVLQVSIAVYGSVKHIGTFRDFTEAVCHRYAAEQYLSWNDCDANSSAYQYLKQQGIIK